MICLISFVWVGVLASAMTEQQGWPELAPNQEKQCMFLTRLAKVFYKASYICKLQTKEY